MLQTKMTEILGIKYPIQCGTMQAISMAELVAPVANAGGFCCLPAAAFQDKQAFSTGSLVGKWVGVKVISTHVPTPFAGLCTSTNPWKAQLYKTYIDQNPIDFTTGKPKNNWKFLFSHLDDGSESGIYAGHKTTWGMKEFQYRINEAKNIDFAYLSVHDIDPTTGLNIPS